MIIWHHLELGVGVELEGEAAEGEGEHPPLGIKHSGMGGSESLKANHFNVIFM